MRSEGLIATATVVAIVGGWRKEGKWPSSGASAIMAGFVLTGVVSFADDTKVEPIVKALSGLALLAVILKVFRSGFDKNVESVPQQVVPDGSTTSIGVV